MNSIFFVAVKLQTSIWWKELLYHFFTDFGCRCQCFPIITSSADSTKVVSLGSLRDVEAELSRNKLAKKIETSRSKTRGKLFINEIVTIHKWNYMESNQCALSRLDDWLREFKMEKKMCLKKNEESKKTKQNESWNHPWTDEASKFIVGLAFGEMCFNYFYSWHFCLHPKKNLQRSRIGEIRRNRKLQNHFFFRKQRIHQFDPTIKRSLFSFNSIKREISFFQFGIHS